MGNNANDFEIEITDTQSQSTASVQLPLNFTKIGEVQREDVQVYIKQDVYNNIEKYSSSDTHKELGGILVGDCFSDSGRHYVIISSYIEAKYTDASSSTLTFTHKSWEYIHGQLSKLYSDKKMVGWQHTHPNYGIFLSNYDMFIQENFFNLPWQVAYVVDPINSQRGFFQWKDGKVSKLEGFFIYDDAGKVIKIKKEAKTTISPGKKSSINITMAAAVIVLAGLLCYSMLNAKQLKSSLEASQEQRETLAAENNTLAKDKENLSNQVKASDGKIAGLQEEIQKLTEGKTILIPQGSSSEYKVFKVYKVKNGDNIFQICRAMDLEYYAAAQTIKIVNGIQDLHRIYAGQILLVPADANQILNSNN